MGANILLFVCSNIVGAIDFYIGDRRQRRSVLETRQSLEVKIALESENRQQVRKGPFTQAIFVAQPNAIFVALRLQPAEISSRF